MWEEEEEKGGQRVLTNKRDDSGRKTSKAGQEEEALGRETLENGMQELQGALLCLTPDCPGSPSIPRTCREQPPSLPGALQPHQNHQWEERPQS